MAQTHRALDTGQFRFWLFRSFEVPDCLSHVGSDRTPSVTDSLWRFCIVYHWYNFHHQLKPGLKTNQQWLDTKYPFPELKSDNGSVEDKMMVILVMMEVIIMVMAMIMTKMTQLTLMLINLNSDMMVGSGHPRSSTSSTVEFWSEKEKQRFT